MKIEHIHILFPEGTAAPLYAFAPSDAAYATARAMLGVDVVTLPVLTQIPEVIRDDLETDFDDRDDTPAIASVSVDDVD